MSITIRPVTPTGLQSVTFGKTDFEDITGGVGGWESLDRARRATATAWVGLPEKTLTLALILNGIDAGGPRVDRSVEADCDRVARWGQRYAKTDEPAILQVIGLTTVPRTERWVVQDIAWGPYVRSGNGQRIQQELTISLLRYIEAEIVKGAAARAKNRHKAKGKPKGKPKPKAKGKK